MSEITEAEIKAMTKEQNYIRGYKDGKHDVLDKIEAEIEQEIASKPMEMWDFRSGLTRAFEIVDKYREESDIKKRKELSHKPCINYEDGCEEWTGCPCVHYKAESEDEE